MKIFFKEDWINPINFEDIKDIWVDISIENEKEFVLYIDASHKIDDRIIEIPYKSERLANKRRKYILKKIEKFNLGVIF